MSFRFTWPTFSPEFHADAQSLLDSALNRGPKPKVIADDIKVDELSMGSVPPDLEILEIGDLSRDRFRGIFRLTYAGDAHIVLSTKVQANPLSKPAPSSGMSSSSSSGSVSGLGQQSSQQDMDTFAPFSSMGSSTRGILFAATPLIVPMKLRLSHVRLRAIIVLVVSKTKGITLVFKNDPLESVQVSSTFDSVAVIAKYLQQEIEGQLKEVFREDLPGIIHRLSQKWLSGQTNKSKDAAEKKKKKKQPDGAEAAERTDTDLRDDPSSFAKSRKKAPSLRKASSAAGYPPASSSIPHAGPSSVSGATPRKVRASSNASRRPLDAASNSVSPLRSSDPPPTLTSTQSMSAIPTLSRLSTSIEDEDEDERADHFPPSSSFDYQDIESYDPTYGLRPDEVRLPKKGQGFRGLKSLKRHSLGLGLGGGVGVGLGGLLLDQEAERQEEEERLALQEALATTPEHDATSVSDEHEGDRHDSTDERALRERDGLSSPQSDEQDLGFEPDLLLRPDSEPGSEEDEDEDTGHRTEESLRPLEAKNLTVSRISSNCSDPDDNDPFDPADTTAFRQTQNRDGPAAIARSTSRDSGRPSHRASQSIGSASPQHLPSLRNLQMHRPSSAFGMGGPASVVSSSSSRGQMMPRAQSTTGVSRAGSGASTPSFRPRFFHSSSLVRPPEVTFEGSPSADGSFDCRRMYAGGLSPHNAHQARSIVSGAGSTIRGGAGSNVGSSRTFTLRRKGHQSDSPYESEDRDATIRGPLQSNSSPALPQWPSGEGALHDGDDFFEEDEDRDFVDEEGDVSHPPFSGSSSASSSNPLRSSQAGTLATLDPEPMDEGSSAYRRHLYQQKYGGQAGLYRPGYGGGSASVVTGKQAAAKGGTTSGAGRSMAPRLSHSFSTSAMPVMANEGSTGLPRSSSRPTYHASHSSLDVPGHGQQRGQQRGQQQQQQQHPPTRPAMRNQLSDLMISNQTLSPYTRLGDTKGWRNRTMPSGGGSGSGSGDVSAQMSRSGSATGSGSGSGRGSGTAGKHQPSNTAAVTGSVVSTSTQSGERDRDRQGHRASGIKGKSRTFTVGGS